MSNAVALNMKGQAVGSEPAASETRGYQVPLSFLGSGEVASVLKVRGKEDLQRHLETMGFVAGAEVKVVSQVSGNIIVEVKGTQVALSQQVASHIVTSSSR